jgi:hypothetical protein|tara:strand:- start:54 stop:251 length:198 start_codon:yes stop_codon:yes gene_type:complete
MKFLIIVFMFFVIGALIVLANNNLTLYDDENIEEFSELYVEWLNRVYSNSRDITGQVISLNWFPE